MTEETKDKPAEDVKDPETLTPEEAVFLSRRDAFFSAVERIVNETRPFFQVKNPLADLVHDSLFTLKKYIEDPTVKEVSWESPWVEARFAVEWDWERGGLRFTPPAMPYKIMEALIRGEDPERIARTDAAIKFMADCVLLPYLPTTLQYLTKQVAVHVKDGKTAGYFFLDPKVKEEVDALPTQEERNARMTSLLEPLSIGGLEVISEEGKPVILTPYFKSPEWAKDLERRLQNIPQMIFKGEVGGVPFMGSVVIVFHALVVDEDKREAYFPIMTGLVFGMIEPIPEHWSDISEWRSWDLSLGPSTWHEEDREVFWKMLLVDLVERIREIKEPEEEPEEEKRVIRQVQCFESKETTEAAREPAPSSSPAALFPIVAPAPERRPTAGVAFGHALVSAQAMNIVKDAHKVHFPKKWSTLQRWEKLMEDEVRSIYEEEGDHALEDLRKTTGDREERGPLLRRVTKGGKESMVLTAEAQDRLRRRAGLGRGFLKRDPYGQERLYRLFELGRGGLLEVGFSWQGLAGPLVEEWRNDLKRQAEAEVRELEKEAPLFEDLDAEKKERLEGLLSRINLWEDGRRIMETILGQVWKQRRNPVEIPAEAFRVLLWPKLAMTRAWPQNWKQRVEGALTALNALTFEVKSYHAKREPKGYGSMVGEWWYKPLGPGDHGDGVYIIAVTPGFMGCLDVFQSGKTRLRSGREVIVFDTAKELTKEEKEKLGWVKGGKPEDTFVTTDAGEPFYAAAAGLTSTQENLLRFIESNITLRKDPARKENKAAQVPKRAADAHYPRLYSSSFCPLLPEGKNYFGALGHFKRTPEAGFTLCGSESRASRHHGGLLFHMSHKLSAGAARAKRAAVIKKALEDIKTVAVDYLGGIVVGHDKVKWTALEDFKGLDERTLTRRLRLFFFLPEDYEAKRRAKWEETTGRRVTENPEEAERETWEKEEKALGSEVVTEKDGFRGWPLHRRLRAVMVQRKLRQKDLASMFGVSAPVITYWLKGTEPEEDGVVRGLPIPEDVAPLIVRWVESGEVPTAEELAALKARRAVKSPGKRSGRRGRVKKPGKKTGN